MQVPICKMGMKSDSTHFPGLEASEGDRLLGLGTMPGGSCHMLEAVPAEFCTAAFVGEREVSSML